MSRPGNATATGDENLPCAPPANRPGPGATNQQKSLPQRLQRLVAQLRPWSPALTLGGCCLLLLGLQLAHFVLLREIQPAEIGADGFRYYWDVALTKYFFLNSSLVVRLAFWLLGNDKYYITLFHLIVSSLALLPFAALALRERDRYKRWFLLLLLSGISLSEMPKWFAALTHSESLTVSVMLFFITAVLMLTPRKVSLIAPLAAGLLFAFTRNTSPYAEIFILLGGAALLTQPLVKPLLRHYLIVAGFCLLCSVSAMKIVQSNDSQLTIAVANNLISRIFPDSEKVKLFHEKYGMPVGPFIDACTGCVVNNCFEGQEIYSHNHESTRSYRITNDMYGFANWIYHKGFSLWTHYLLFDAPLDTLQWIRADFPLSLALLQREPRTSFDLFYYSSPVLVAVGLGNIFGALAFVAASVGLNYFIFRSRFLAAMILLAATGIFVLALVAIGDVTELRQHWTGAFPYLFGITGIMFYYLLHVSGKLAGLLTHYCRSRTRRQLALLLGLLTLLGPVAARSENASSAAAEPPPTMVLYERIIHVATLYRQQEVPADMRDYLRQKLLRADRDYSRAWVAADSFYKHLGIEEHLAAVQEAFKYRPGLPLARSARLHDIAAVLQAGRVISGAITKEFRLRDLTPAGPPQGQTFPAPLRLEAVRGAAPDAFSLTLASLPEQILLLRGNGAPKLEAALVLGDYLYLLLSRHHYDRAVADTVSLLKLTKDDFSYIDGLTLQVPRDAQCAAFCSNETDTLFVGLTFSVANAQAGAAMRWPTKSLIVPLSAELRISSDSCFLGGSAITALTDMFWRSGRLYVAGYTSSRELYNLSRLGTTTPAGAVPPSHYGVDGFVLTFTDPALTTIGAATIFGGAGDEFPGQLLRGPHNFYCLGNTTSETLPPAVPAQKNSGKMEGFVSTLAYDSLEIVASNFLGTWNHDQVTGSVLGSSAQQPQQLVVTGTTNAIVRFPATSSGIQSHYGGGKWDGYLLRLTEDLAVDYASLFGGTDNDYPQSLVQTASALVMIGYTESGPSLPGLEYAYQARDMELGTYNCFITRFSPDLSSLIGTDYIRDPADAICALGAQLDDKILLLYNGFP